MKRLFFLLVLMAFVPSCATAQQATNVQKDKDNKITGNLTIGSGKTLTIASGGSIVAAAGSTVTGFGSGGGGNGTVTGNNLTANSIVTGNGTTAIKVSGVTIDGSDNIVTGGNLTANNITGNVVATTGNVTTLNATNIAGATANGQLLIGNATSGNFTKAVPTGTQGITITGSGGGLAVGFVAPGTTGNVLTSNGTAWTSAAASGGVAAPTVNAQTGTTYTLVLGDANNIVTMTNGSANTLTIPLNASVAFPTGTVIAVQQGGAGNTTISPASGATLNGASSNITLGTQYQWASLVKLGTDTWSLAYATAGGGGGSGTVTSVALSGSNGVSVSGSPITTNGTITVGLGAITPTSVNGIALSGASTPTLSVTGTTAVSGTNTGDQNLFGSVAVSGQTTVTANATNQTLNIVGGNNVAVTTDNTTKTVTISATGNVTKSASLTTNYLTYATGTGSIATAPNLYLYGDALTQDVSTGHSYMMIRTLGASYSSWLDLSTTTNYFQFVNDGTKLGITNGFTHQEFIGNTSSTAYTKFLSDKASTSASTGAVVIGTTGSTAGLGVLGNINAGGNLSASNFSGSHSGTSSGTNTGDQTISLTGDVTGSGTGSFAATLATVNSNTGTFGNATTSPSFTVNGKGLITAVSNVTVTPAVGSITGLGTGVATALGNSAIGSGNIVLGTNATLTTPTLSGNVTQDGANIVTANAMGALSIDVGKWLNTKSISADSTFTFSGTPGTNTMFTLAVANSDSASHTLTIPSSYSVGQAATITSVSIPASGKLHLQWRYDGSTYWIHGDPVPLSGSGTVTSFSSGNLSPLFTTSVATATSTPALSYTLSNQNANIVLAGPTTGAAAAPTFRSLVAADIPTIANAGLANSTVTLGNTSMSLGSTTTNVTGLNSLTFGTPAFSDTDYALQGTANVNSYYQIELINTNAGTTASTDISLHRDGATSTTNYLDLGINSSGFTGSGSLGRATAGYLYTQTDELVVGTNANKSFTVVTNGTDRAVITGAGALTYSGTINQTDTTASTAYTNGALITAGGIGAAKDIITNGNLTATNGVTSIKTKVAGKTHKFLNNFSTGSQSPTAATRTYITGSNLNFTAGDLVAGTVIRWRFNMTKTAAGTAASTFDIAFGTAGTTADTARVSFTKPAGTAVVDEAWVEISCVIRSVGASGVANGEFKLAHNLSATGHATIPNVVVNTTSAGFDTTTVTNVGLCITSGTADVITIQQCTVEAVNL